jgi:hypothetical protein
MKLLIAAAMAFGWSVAAEAAEQQVSLKCVVTDDQGRARRYSYQLEPTSHIAQITLMQGNVRPVTYSEPYRTGTGYVIISSIGPSNTPEINWAETMMISYSTAKRGGKPSAYYFNVTEIAPDPATMYIARGSCE